MNVQNITIKKLPESMVAIDGVLPLAALETFRASVEDAFVADIELDGFRKGKAPKDMVLKKVGELAILEKMAIEGMTIAYPEILVKEKIDAIGRPDIVFTKIAPGSDVSFTITTAVAPTLTLPDYKKIAQEHMQSELSVTVTDEEFQSALLEIRKMRAHQQMHADGIPHDSHNHNDIPEDALPEYNDEFVKGLGDFTDVADFETKYRENMHKEKLAHEQEKRRVALLETLTEKTGAEIPKIFITFEQEKMFQQFAYDISMAGLQMDDYLKRIGKTKEQMFEEWYETARKRAVMQLMLTEIAQVEKIVPPEEDIAKQLEQMKNAYKDHKDFSEDRAKEYLHTMITNQQVIAFLESQK